MDVDEERVKEVLGSYQSSHETIHKRIIDIHDELSATDALIRSASIKKIEWGKEGGPSGGIKSDLTDVMLLHERLERQHEIELRTELYRLVEEEESINRIMVCFRALSGREHQYIDQLYIKKQPYKAVEAECGTSHRTFELIRKRGLQQILSLYKSDLSNLDILTSLHRRKHAQGAKTVKKDYEQLKLKLH